MFLSAFAGLVWTMENANADVNTIMRFQATENGGFRKRHCVHLHMDAITRLERDRKLLLFYVPYP